MTSSLSFTRITNSRPTKLGSKEDVAARIDADTRVKIEEMNSQLNTHRNAVMMKILDLVYDIKPELHKNYQLQAH